jgi:anti-sigma regulatory factor (Ser/Thr protein kinase)
MTFKIYCEANIFTEKSKTNDFTLAKTRIECDLALLPIEQAKETKTPTIYYSSDDNLKNIEIVRKHSIKNLIGCDISQDPAILKPYLNSLLINKQFSPEYFLGNNSKQIQMTVTDNTQINSKQDEILSLITEKISWDFHRDHFQIVLNELLTNAFYNASGNNQTRRTNLITLQNISKVEINCEFDDQYFICAVKDYYGALTWEKFITSLSRGMIEKSPEDKKGGAGLGLYLMFSHCSGLAVNVKPGEFTEFFWILEKSKRQKDNLTRAKSLNFYEII